MVIILEDEYFYHHSYLDKVDDSEKIFYFYDDYIPKGTYRAGDTNSLISNYKKSINSPSNQLYWKTEAIRKVSDLINSNFRDLKDDFTFVPIPPSKVKTSDLYDDRNHRCLQLAKSFFVKDIISFTESHEPFHISGIRTNPEELITKLELLNVPITTPNIILFDDFLTSGSHFKACKNLLQQSYPEKTIYGLFIARRKLDDPTDDFDVEAYYGDLW